MRRIRVASKLFSYDIMVGRGAWRALRRFPLKDYSSFFVLTEERLWSRWGKLFLRESGLRGPRCVWVPGGEASKTLRMVERVAGRLLALGADRKSLLITVGGGVIGDLGGFIASTYMRGIDYIQVPTTVVAQVDSAIGGKTGVDVGAMKNLVGTFYPPRLVLSEPRVLSSLEARAFRSGLYEVVKHGILAGPEFFQQLEAGLATLLAAQVRSLEPILAKAAAVKVNVVSRDEREGGLRRVLNLGHTFGHALEEATHYRRFLHGEAVGWGMLAAFRLGERLGLLRTTEGARMARLVRRVGPLPPIRDLAAARILRLLPRDKKAVGGRIHWVVPEGIGKVRVVSDVPEEVATAALRDVQQAEGHD
jgi:3-dehydroquinate synthase